MINFESTKENIAKDVEEVFRSIQDELYNNFIRGSRKVGYTKNALLGRVPDLVCNKSLLLLDTVSIYLVKDARKALKAEDYNVIIEFHKHNQEWLDKIKVDFQKTLKKKDINFSSDLRPVYGGTAGAVGLVAGKIIGAMLFSPATSWGIALVLATGLFIGIYSKTTSVTLDKMKDELDEYLTQSHQVTLNGLNGVIVEYENNFARFLKEIKDTLSLSPEAVADRHQPMQDQD